MRKETISIMASGFLGLAACDTSQQAPEAQISEAQLSESIEAFIRQNPDVIVETLNDYAARKEDSTAKSVIRENLAALLASDDGFVTGAPAEDARVVVVEFMDYHCGYCKKAASKMSELAANESDVAVVFRELPILREESLLAAKYALAARAQGRYLDYHLEMMNSNGVLTQNRLDDMAREIGLDPKSLGSEALSPAQEKSIDNTREIAIGIGLTGTPAFVVASTDGTYVEVIRGWSLDTLEAAIKEARTGA